MKKFIWVLFLSTSIFATCGENAQRLRAEIETSQNPLMSFLDVLPVTEEFELNVKPVFGQGSTNYCWAYAGLHTLRTFYGNVSGADKKWRDFLEAFDTASKYSAYIKKVTGANEGGWPNEAVYFYGLSIGSPTIEKWVSFVPSKTQTGFGPHPGPDLHPYTPEGYFTTMEAIENRIRTGLMKGAPTAYCTSAHCVTIYGASYSGTQAVTYRIADSAGGNVYTSNATSMHQKLADVTTLW